MTLKPFIGGGTMTAPKAMSSAAPDQSSNSVIAAARSILQRQHEREASYASQEKALLADATKCWEAVQIAAELIQTCGIPASLLKWYHDEGRRSRKRYAIKFPKNPNRGRKKK